LGYGFFFAVAKLAFWSYKREAIGEGDFKLAAMLGAGLGLKGLFFAVFAAYVLGAVVSVFLIGLKIKTLKDNIPFGPFLVVGAVLSLFFGQAWLQWYFGG
jgi:leader peptidase (prepilin peptidase)/N-methyltransferase